MITIENLNKESYRLRVRNIEDGKAYESEDGKLFIGNRIITETIAIVAFSVDGSQCIRENSNVKFREVDLLVKIL